MQKLSKLQPKYSFLVPSGKKKKSRLYSRASQPCHLLTFEAGNSLLDGWVWFVHCGMVSHRAGLYCWDAGSSPSPRCDSQMSPGVKTSPALVLSDYLGTCELLPMWVHCLGYTQSSLVFTAPLIVHSLANMLYLPWVLWPYQKRSLFSQTLSTLSC